MDVKQFGSDKILAHIDRVNEWLKTGLSHPVTYELDMTNICNMRCPFCFGFFGKSNASLRLNEAKDIIKQVRDFGGRGLTFTGGGEPLCNPATPETVRYANQAGIDIGFITNGLALNEDIAKVLVKNCVWIRISLDAASPEVYETTHGIDKKHYQEILENIKLLVMIKKKEKSSCTLGIGYLTPPVKKKEIAEFAILGKKLGVDYAQYRPLLRRYGEEEIGYDDIETIEEIENTSTKLSSGIYSVLYSKHKYDDLKNGKLTRDYDKCYGHHFATVISADRKMYLCCHMRGVEKYCLGNLSVNSLREIWHSERRKEIYSSIDFKDCPYLCRCNTFNTVLWNIRQTKPHKNFL